MYATSLFIIAENLCHKNYKGTTKEDIIMDIKVSRRESSKNTKTHTCSKNQHLEDIRLDDNNTTEEVFPWLSKFNKVVHSYAGSRNFQHLEELLLLYTQ